MKIPSITIVIIFRVKKGLLGAPEGVYKSSGGLDDQITHRIPLANKVIHYQLVLLFMVMKMMIKPFRQGRACRPQKLHEFSHLAYPPSSRQSQPRAGR